MAAPDPDSTFRILVTSDIHLGYGENDPIRGNDSFITFEEILSIARDKNVDFILHGGDLFHENKPSRNTLHASFSLLREYCMGDKPVQFEYQSDQSTDYQHCKFPSVNYEDPNLNISIPMFSIHGNHDDPTGPGNLCSLDLLHTAGLVNYFGKYLSLDNIQVSPLLLKKGSSRLALYGLGSIRDERLHRIFVNKKLTMLRPKDDGDGWFNMMVLHQNRAKHSNTSYIPEHFLSHFLDLVVWGHEHECRLKVSEEAVEWNPVQQFYVCQPGSSVATSLSEGEKVPKHVGLLEINNKNFRMQPIPLKSVRQFYMQDLDLAKLIKEDTKAEDAMNKAEIICSERVEEMLSKADAEHSGDPKQPIQPLIRLRVDYTGFMPFSAQRFGKKFVDRVANPKQIVHFVRKRIQNTDTKPTPGVVMANIPLVVLDSGRVEDMVQTHFRAAEGDNRLELLTERGMGLAVKEYVEKEEREAIKELVQYQLNKMQNHLKSRNAQEDSICSEVLSFKQRKNHAIEEEDDAKEAIQRARAIRESQGGQGFSDEEANHSGEEDSTAVATPAPRGRGRGRGSRGGTRGARGSTTRGRGRGKKEPVVVNNDIIKEENDSFSSSAAVSQRGGRGSRGGKRASGQKTISDMMSKSARNRIEDSDEDLVILDDSDDDYQSQPRGAKKAASSAKSRKKPAIQYTEVSSEEEDYKPPPSRKRR